MFSVLKYIPLLHRFWIIQSAKVDYLVRGMRLHMRVNSISTSGRTDRHSYFLLFPNFFFRVVCGGCVFIFLNSLPDTVIRSDQMEI